MCVYCVCSDWAYRWIPPPNVPPWTPSPIDPYPFPGPAPVRPPVEWTPDMLREFADLLDRIKQLEDQAAAGGTAPPCFADPRKMEFLEQIKAQLDRIEAKRGSDEPNQT